MVILLGKSPHKVSIHYFYHQQLGFYVWGGRCETKDCGWKKIRRTEKEIRYLGEQHESFPHRD